MVSMQIGSACVSLGEGDVKDETDLDFYERHDGSRSERECDGHRMRTGLKLILSDGSFGFEGF
jgi:hypothetical protein